MTVTIRNGETKMKKEKSDIRAKLHATRMLVDEKTKMKNGKADAELEAKRKLVDEKTELIFKELREADYGGAAFKGVSEAYNGKFAEQASLSETVAELADNVDEAEESFDGFIKEEKPSLKKLKLTEEKFLFSGGDEANVRRVQLQALKYANACFNFKGVVSNSVKTLDEQLEEMRSDDAFKSTVILKSKPSFEDIKNALTNVDDEALGKYSVEVLASALFDRRRFDCYHDLASEIKKCLNASGIECIVANRTSENVFNEQKSVQEKKVPKIVDTYYTDILGSIDVKRKYDKIRQSRIWAPPIAILVATYLLYVILCLFRNLSMNVAAIFIVGVTLAVGYVIAYCVVFLVLKRKEQTKNLLCEAIKSEINQYIEMQKKPQIIEEFGKLFDIYEICDRVDEKIISPYCAKMNEIIERCDSLRAKLFELLSRINKEADEINYMPSGAKIEQLPKIIEFMESGAADNYQEAAYQVIQYELANACNKAQIAIMEAAEEQRKTEARAQREMQEYYERQRLNEARQAAARQAESTRRAEQYAKEQAESAKRAEEAQRDAAKYAEKQTEIAEELLRRAKYGG